MAADYYKTLGVARNASPADIQKAYRELARKHHPDMNPDKPGAVKKFQEIQAAFDVLNNPEKREMYDRYGSSFETMGQGRPHAPNWGAGPGGGFNAEDIDFGQFFGERFGEGGGGLGDIFSHVRRAAGRGGGGSSKRRGSDVASEVTIPFATAVSGGEVQLGLRRQSGETETIVVKIPPGIDDGKKMRLRGKGEPASGRGTAGDLMLTVHVAPHPFFARKGNDLARPPADHAWRGRGRSERRRAHAQRDGRTPRSAGDFQRQEAADQGAWRGPEERRQGRLAGRGADRASRQLDRGGPGNHPSDR